MAVTNKISLEADGNNVQSAYLESLGLKHPPFPVVPDTLNFYQPERIYILLTEVLHTIQQRQGFVVITGEIGLGKTTLTRQLLKALEQQQIQTALIVHTFLPAGELLEAINQDFGLTVSGGMQTQLSALNHFLIEQYQRGINCTLMIDDAQHLSIESLELIRQLSNLETETEKLIQIILVGQPELLQKLAQPELRQLNSRIVLQREVTAYTPEEMAQYIHYKLTRASVQPRLHITSAAFSLLFKVTQGNPRKINLLMNRCLYAAVADQTVNISKTLVKRVASEWLIQPDSHKTFPLIAFGLVGLLTVVSYFYLTPVVQQSMPVQPQISPSTKKVIIPAELITFMRYYGLGRYTESFFQALQKNDFTGLKEQINRATGLRLIILNQPQSAIAHHFALLRYTDQINHQTVGLLFWQPEHWIDHFYPTAKGPAIAWLQQRLKSDHLYLGTVDGIVGQLTQQALIDYQRIMGLDQTGIADEITQFYLHQDYLSKQPNIAKQ